MCRTAATCACRSRLRIASVESPVSRASDATSSSSRSRRAASTSLYLICITTSRCAVVGDLPERLFVGFEPELLREHGVLDRDAARLRAVGADDAVFVVDELHVAVRVAGVDPVAPARPVARVAVEVETRLL